LTILDYDEVMAFDDGIIVKRGSPVELINQKGRFYEMLI
jgi:ABC-type multidrug transport system fused ATPase/permease subunit